MVSLSSVEVSLKLLDVIFTPLDPVLQRQCELLLLKIFSLPFFISCERERSAWAAYYVSCFAILMIHPATSSPIWLLTLFSLCSDVMLHGPQHRTQLGLVGGQLLTAYYACAGYIDK